MAEGLRERKKRETRRRIADAAAGLFTARGFDAVTIAEVAAAADVSVNTVYNYFETKEDLVLPPHQGNRLAAIVAAREPGESAAEAVLRRLREEVRRRDPVLGLTPGFAAFHAMMRAAPTLLARLDDIAVRMEADLAALLARETGAGPDDPVPGLVAGQIGWLHARVLMELGRRTEAGHDVDATAGAMLDLLDAAEGLLGPRVLDYARR
ncbi:MULTISPECIES: TetR/AcrR family transcriptional regulator [Actinomadura]|uniref:TetR/AcrR family transcriptional regulator n=1 Tax=Actinomadura TaxID=1988 RepID=UPI00041B7B53|nr:MULTISPECIES: TetR/AcrR family transcriptional regulator [Actinomadura]RSN68494.1 TetR/AcrR family transcriptional regulator [Actinomadura sp. WAC 06369]